jgi:hypothetical protein
MRSSLWRKQKSKYVRGKTIREQSSVLKGEGEGNGRLEELHSLHRRQKKPASKGTGTYRGRGDKKTPSTKSCTRCGKGAHSREKCPARDAICHSCKKKGHFSLTKPFVGEINEENSVEGPYLDAIISDQNAPWLSDIEVNGKLLRFKLDTGADVSAISELTYKNLQRTGQLTQSSKSLLGPSGQSLPY